VRALLADPGIVRNRLKVESAVKNARHFLALADEPGGADAFLWHLSADVPGAMDGRTVERFRDHVPNPTP